MTGRLARLARFVITHQSPVGGDLVPRDLLPRDRAAAGRPTVGLLACHAVAGGYGDQVVALLERVLHRRGHVLGPLAAVDARAPVVVVAHAGRRAGAARPLAGAPPEHLVGRDVALVVYSPEATPDPGPLEAVRTALSAAGARVGSLTAPLDTAGLHRAALTTRPLAPRDDVRTTRDPFGLVALELTVDELLDREPSRGAP